MRTTIRLAFGLVLVAGCGRIGFDVAGSDSQGAIEGLRLVQAADAARTLLADPLDGAKLDVTPWIPTPGFAVEAIVPDEPPSVHLDVNGAHWVENNFPYTSRGDDGDPVFFDRELRVGANTVVVSTFGEGDRLLDRVTASFELDLPTVPGGILTFALVDAQTNTNIGAITDSSSFSIAALPPMVNIEAVLSPATTGNVRFDLSGPVARHADAHWPPYRAFDPGFAPLPGSYTLTAIPSDRGDGTGTPGTGLVVLFSVTP